MMPKQPFAERITVVLEIVRTSGPKQDSGDIVQSLSDELDNVEFEVYGEDDASTYGIAFMSHDGLPKDRL